MAEKKIKFLGRRINRMVLNIRLLRPILKVFIWDKEKFSRSSLHYINIERRGIFTQGNLKHC